MRTLAAAVALGIGGLLSLPYLVGGVAGARMGSALFGVLTWLTFLACLSAGLFFTSDCISQEKREGTLGFLFLTDLRGIDVLLGKLFATSLRASYAMLAVLPVLALPLLMGGVEAGQFWKSSLACLNAVLCSLSAGILVSTLSRAASRAFSGALLLMVGWCALGPLLSAVYRAWTGVPGLEVAQAASPFFTFVAAQPGMPSARFWKSLILNLAGAWACLGIASVLVRRTWQDRRLASSGGAERKFGRGMRSGARRRLRKWMDPNPVVWLVRRSGRQADGVWALALLACGIAVTAALLGIPPQGWMFWNVVGSLFSLVLFVIVGAQAPRVFVEARQNGLMELLMSTPLTAKDIVGGHWRAQLRMFAPPLLLYVFVNAIATALAGAFAWGNLAGGGRPGYSQVLLGLILSFSAVASTLADIAALFWFGMWMGMTSKSTNLAALKTIVLVQVAPSLVIGVVSSLIAMLIVMPRLISSSGGNAVSATMAGGTFALASALVPLALKLGKDALFISWSRRKLHQNLRQWAVPAAAEAWMPVPPVIPGAPRLRDART